MKNLIFEAFSSFIYNRTVNNLKAEVSQSFVPNFKVSDSVIRLSELLRVRSAIDERVIIPKEDKEMLAAIEARLTRH